MKSYIGAAGALAIAGSAFGIAAAQSESGQSPGGDHRGAIHQACQADIDKLCAGVQPGGGRIMQCMREHQDQVSDGCKSAMMSMHGHHGGQGG